MNKTGLSGPIKNEQVAGLCNPCRYTIEEGMEYKIA